MLAVLNVLYNKGKAIELLVNYEPLFIMFLNGGSSYLEKVKGKIKRAFSCIG
jgi:hypothetical protein